jgi:hypothetical protein
VTLKELEEGFVVANHLERENFPHPQPFFGANMRERIKTYDVIFPHSTT